MINHIRKELVLLRETHHDDYVSRRVNNVLDMLEELERNFYERPDKHPNGGVHSGHVVRGVDCDIFRHSMDVMLDGSLD